MFKYVLIFFVLLFFLIKGIFANVINKIFIKGNLRIDSSTVLSYINIKKDQEISEEDLNGDLRLIISLKI